MGGVLHEIEVHKKLSKIAKKINVRVNNFEIFMINKLCGILKLTCRYRGLFMIVTFSPFVNQID